MKRLLRVVVAILAALGLLVVLVTFTPFVSWYGGKLAGAWKDPRGDTLIVLGGGSFDGFPSQSTVIRCLYAVRAQGEAPFRRMVLSGAGISGHMRRLISAEGVPIDIITIEDRSRSTRENALFTAGLLAGAPGSKVLLTSDYHMFRALRCFRKVGMNLLPCPVPDARKRAGGYLSRWPAFLDEIEESVKIIYYFSHGWI